MTDPRYTDGIATVGTADAKRQQLHSNMFARIYVKKSHVFKDFYGTDFYGTWYDVYGERNFNEEAVAIMATISQTNIMSMGILTIEHTVGWDIWRDWTDWPGGDAGVGYVLCSVTASCLSCDRSNEETGNRWAKHVLDMGLYEPVENTWTQALSLSISERTPTEERGVPWFGMESKLEVAPAISLVLWPRRQNAAYVETLSEAIGIGKMIVNEGPITPRGCWKKLVKLYYDNSLQPGRVDFVVDSASWVTLTSYDGGNGDFVERRSWHLCPKMSPACRESPLFGDINLSWRRMQPTYTPYFRLEIIETGRAPGWKPNEVIDVIDVQQCS